ncbi:hypothetical protein DVH24_026517, partial [Malus domestica]
PHGFVFWNSHENFPVGHPSWECSRPNSLNFGVSMEPEANELPKDVMLEPILGRKCADEDVGPLRGVDCNIPLLLGEWILTKLFGSSLASGSIGTPKLSEFGREHSQDE